MRNLLAFLCGLFLALVAGLAFSQSATCPHQPYEYQVGGGPWVGSVVAAVTPSAQYCADEWNADRNACSLTGSTTRTWVVTGCTEAYPVSTCSYQGNHATLAPIFRTRDFATTRRNTVDCPVDPCVAAQELADPVMVMGAESVSGELCGSDDGSGGTYSGGLYGKGCRVVKRGAGITSPSGHWYGQVSYTGSSCGASAAPENTASNANCIVQAGKSICVSRDSKNCGTVGGERVCLDAIPDNSCALTSDGGALCMASATDPPKDAMGDPLPADAELTRTAEPTGDTEGATETVNYFSSVTVSTSYSIVTGASTAGGGESGEGEGGSLDDLEGGDMEAVDGFGESAGGFWDRVEASPLVSAVSGLSGSLTGGTCPAWNETVEAGAFGTYELDFSFICGIWEDIAPVISAVMLAVFALAALRILMSA